MHVLFLILLFFCFVEKPKATLDPFHFFTLKNGAKVVVIEDHKSPIVALTIIYKSGSTFDPLHKSGVAHFLEHMMFQGTTVGQKDDFKTIVSKMGGSTNALTHFDETMYYTVIPKRHLEELMSLEALRMKSLSFTKERFEKERRVVLEERTSRLDDVPSALADEVSLSRFHMNHPYGRPVIGWQEEIETIQEEDVINFHQSWYAPDNAVIVFSGDISAEEAKNLSQKYFEPISKTRSGTPPKFSDFTANFGKQTLEFVHPEFGFGVEASYPLPLSLQEKWGDFKTRLHLGLLTMLVEKKLQKIFVEDLKVLERVHVNIDITSHLPTRMTVTLNAKNIGDVFEMTHIVGAFLKNFAINDCTLDDLEKAKFQYKTIRQVLESDLLQIGIIYGGEVVFGTPLQTILDWPKLIESFAVKDAQDYLSLIVSSDPKMIVYKLYGENKR